MIVASVTNTFLLGQMNRYQVIGAVAVVELTNGSLQYVYQGGFLPVESSPRNVEHLLEQGLVKEIVR